jgi:molybdopterin synthase catalytic subunit
MGEKKKKQVLVDGPISPGFIAQSIEKHQTKTDIGAHSIFLGQVRADEKDNRTVIAIDYTCYPEMAEPEFDAIREEAFAKFDLSCMHIYHSLGTVKSGEISLFVFTSSKHRTNAIDACTYIVEAIKKRVPIWGKELLSDETHLWKTNT